MRRLPPTSRPPAAARIAAIATCLFAMLSGRAHAVGLPLEAPPQRPWVSFGVLSGATQFDGHLAEYQWNVQPRAALGLQALAGLGRGGVGFRVTQARTRQHIATASVTNPAVRATRCDVLARARLLSRLGVGLDAFGTIGRLHLGYAPDHVTLQDTGGSSGIEVALAPVDTWSNGLGLALRRGLPGPWSAAIEFEGQRFALDTAHRNGGAIVVGRERFSEWSARFELARVYGRR